MTIGGGGTKWSVGIIQSLMKDFANGVIMYGDCDDPTEQPVPSDPNNRPPCKHYNSLMFDIENIDSSVNSDSSITNLINGFNDFFLQIKRNNCNWIIGVTMAHNSSFISSKNFIDGMIRSPYLDYISPQMYTADYGTLNEYSRTGYSPNGPAPTTTWSDFYTSVISSPAYCKYGTNIIIPSLWFVNAKFIFNGTQYNGLYKGAGTNAGKIPYLEVNNSIVPSPNVAFPNPQNPNFGITYPTQNDLGAFDFFTKMFYPSPSLGGAVGFANNFPV